MDVATPLRPHAATEAGQGAPDAAGDGVQADAAGTEPRRPSAIRRWLGRVVSLVATLAVVGIAALAAALAGVPAVVGGHTLTVLSGSMVPEFAPGAMVVDRPAPPSSLRVGDVITYATTDEVSGAPILITHRIVEIRSAAGSPTFITQGDANNSADDRPVEASQIRGKVWYSVPYIGTARNFLLARGAGMILGGAAGLIASVWFLLRLVRAPEPRQNAAASAQSPARGGRHRARNATVVTALLGMLLIAGHPVTDRQATYAHFTDQQVLQFQIVGEGATPA
jgi:signal peptidase I